MNLCPKCHATFDGEKWDYNLEVYNRWKKKGVKELLCPGCERIERRRVDGIVNLQGDFLKEHKHEAMNLIKNVAEKKKRKNVAARIFRIEESVDGIHVETTDRSLAERIGKEFEKAFSGSLDISWLKSEDFVRVNWQRS
jgi:NMD protein affecting ribosome stability and mRNA decay